MKALKSATLLIVCLVLAGGCTMRRTEALQAREVYRSNTLVITRIAPHAFIHTSFLPTQDFGNVPCNGVIVQDSNEVIVFDTPVTDSTSEELLGWIGGTLHCKVNAVIPTHFHEDCLGGLNAFHQHGIPSYAYQLTVELATAAGHAVPQHGSAGAIVLPVGQDSVRAAFFGEGHTRDNIVGYFAKDHVLFGGCLIKEVGAGKGYLGDANVDAWTATVARVKAAHPEAWIVVPGHGEHGGQRLLDYTMELFKPN